MNTVKHVIGALGDIGVEVVKETVKVPGEIVGIHSETQKNGNTSSKPTPAREGNQETPLDAIQKTIPADRNGQAARRVLEQYIGIGKPSEKKPDAWEKKKQEEEVLKTREKEKKKREEKQALPTISTKSKKGNLYGVGVKTNLEKQKNVIAE